MAYSLKRGIENDHMDNTQKGLLVGLPAIALALSFGAAHHTAKTPSGPQAKTIPVVASLNTSGGSKSGSGGKTAAPNSSGGQAHSSTGGTYSGPGYTIASSSSGIGSPGGSGSSSSSGSSGSSGGVIGGRGGGPTGGTTSSGTGSTGGGSTSGGSTLPSCSIGQIATVNCLVTSCTPTVSLAPGQKAILGLDGTCVVVN